MAFINKETSAKIRKSLKESFPEMKMSVRIQDHMALYVDIVSSPYFKDGDSFQVNHYYIDEHFEGNQRQVLNNMDKIVREVGEYYNNSDVMSDYFDHAFYYHISVGRSKKDGHEYQEYNLQLPL